MKPERLIASLERFPSTLESIVRTLDEDTWRFESPTGNWSILEIVCHLRDEEVEDFRMRLRLTLEFPEQSWPPIDPVQAALEREYKQDDPMQALDAFLMERKASVQWLHSLGDVDWAQAHPHPKVGDVAAGLLLGSWAAHDLLHLRQITKRLFESTEQQSQPYAIDYAGSWQES